MAGLGQQGVHQSEFARRELHHLAVEVQGATVLVVADGADLHGAGGEGRHCGVRTAAHQGAQTGLQFVQVKRFGQVVVGSGVQAHHPVTDGAARCQDEHRGAQAARPGLLQHLQAVQAGQGQVQDDGIGLQRGPLAERRAPVAHGCDLHAAPGQRAVQRGLHGGVVFYKEQLHARHHSTVSSGPAHECFP